MPMRSSGTGRWTVLRLLALVMISRSLVRAYSLNCGVSGAAPRAKDSEAGRRNRRQKVLAVMRLETVAPVPEENVVAVVQPIEERPRFRNFLLRHRQFGVLELGDAGSELAAHG